MPRNLQSFVINRGRKLLKAKCTQHALFYANNVPAHPGCQDDRDTLYCEAVSVCG